MFNEVYVNSESMSTKQETKKIGWRKTEMAWGGGGGKKKKKKKKKKRKKKKKGGGGGGGGGGVGESTYSP